MAHTNPPATRGAEQKETPVLSEPGLWLVAVEYPEVSDADEDEVEPES